MLYSRERVIRPPGAHGKRHTGSSCLASCFRKSSLTIFHKNNKAPKGGGLTKFPKPKLVSSSMGFPGPRYISGASRDHNIYPSSPFPNFSSFISLIFLSPNSQIIFEALLWLPSPGLHSSYPLGGQCLPTLLGGGQKAGIFASFKVCCRFCWPDFIFQRTISYLEQTGSYHRSFMLIL